MSDEIKNLESLIQNSGIITHNKSVNVLRDGDWSVLVSPYYHDSISDAVRETDIIAEKQVNSAGLSHQSSRQINLQLFIECKYIKQEVVFWFDKMDKKKAVTNLEKETGLAILYDRSSADITPDKFIQLKNDFVAKLFSTNANKEDVIYKAMNQCLHSQIHYREKGKRPILIGLNNRSDSKSKIIQRSVIVCDNFENLFKINFKDSENYDIEKIENHFILETNYRDDYFLVDIVDVNYFSSFLSLVEEETKSIMQAFAYKE